MLSKRVKASGGGGETDRRTEEDKYRLLYWPLTSTLEHSTLSCFQDPTRHFCFSARALWSTTRVGTFNNCKLALTHTAFTWPWHSCSICIYHFIMPTTSAKPYDCFRLFTWVCLWLMVQSRVNMYHVYSGWTSLLHSKRSGQSPEMELLTELNNDSQSLTHLLVHHLTTFIQL